MKYILVMQVKNLTKIAMRLDGQIFGDITTIFSIRNALFVYAVLFMLKKQLFCVEWDVCG